MAARPLAITATGLVTSNGLSAPAACAAIRAKLTNPTETGFIAKAGEYIVGHRVPLKEPWSGRTKLVKMAAIAIHEALATVPREAWAGIPLLLCVAEGERPGRLEGLGEELLLEIERELDGQFAGESATVARGRVSAVIALVRARELIYDHAVPHVLIAATDSLLNWRTLSAYERKQRVLTGSNSNGFMPGEAAGALLVGPPGGGIELQCTGIGLGLEQAHIDSDRPLRAEGLTRAITDALADAGCRLHELDFRITDLSGEQYYFKEAALALARLQRRRKEEFDLWHPAECTGEAGAAAGTVIFAVARAACHKGYAAGPGILAHLADDAGSRAAAVLQFKS
jgi:3-oxoacyl-[acyl-carrier-protein] synthase-1